MHKKNDSRETDFRLFLQETFSLLIACPAEDPQAVSKRSKCFQKWHNIWMHPCKEGKTVSLSSHCVFLGEGGGLHTYALTSFSWLFRRREEVRPISGGKYIRKVIALSDFFEWHFLYFRLTKKRLNERKGARSTLWFHRQLDELWCKFSSNKVVKRDFRKLNILA